MDNPDPTVNAEMLETLLPRLEREAQNAKEAVDKALGDQMLADAKVEYVRKELARLRGEPQP